MTVLRTARRVAQVSMCECLTWSQGMPAAAAAAAAVIVEDI
jgi:hypothetical protein